jgi:hypothetical protein
MFSDPLSRREKFDLFCGGQGYFKPSRMRRFCVLAALPLVGVAIKCHDSGPSTGRETLSMCSFIFYFVSFLPQRLSAASALARQQICFLFNALA